MKSKRPTRCGLAIAVFVGVLAVSTSTEAADPVERITAMTVTGKTTPAETVEIVLLRWSTDAERSQFLPILSGKPTKEGDALDKVSLGYVWGSGSVGYVVRYAERQGDRIILVVYRNLGSWQGKPSWITAPRSLTYQQLLLQIGNEAYEGIKWEHERGVSPEILAKTYGVTAFEVEQVIRTASPEPAAKPIDLTRFSVVELRLAGATPQGKVVSATKIAADVSQGITVSDPGADSVQLRGIKRANASSPAAAPAAAAPKAPDAAPKAPAK
jgi:hypothetical protein